MIVRKAYIGFVFPFFFSLFFIIDIIYLHQIFFLFTVHSFQ